LLAAGLAFARITSSLFPRPSAAVQTPVINIHFVDLMVDTLLHITG
jgi:hypothetical protein